jgi:hypothetical protein
MSFANVLNSCIGWGFPISFEKIIFVFVNAPSFPLVIFLVMVSCGSPPDQHNPASALNVEHDRTAGTISVFRSGGTTPLLVQNAKSAVRPYIHPIMAPDGKEELTEYSPPHHKHQTGLYWGLKKVNGRDYFMNWKGDYWQKVSAEVMIEKGDRVKWETVYNLLDESGAAILEETQTWTFQETEDRFIMDLQWHGLAMTDVTMEKFYVGGLFLRMPWREGIRGEVVNSGGQRNASAEGQRAIWNDVGIQVGMRNNLAHIAIFDHPDNEGFPTSWRVDNELGVGPSRQILGDWTIRKGETEVIRYRLIVYTGDLMPEKLDASWKQFICEESEE